MKACALGVVALSLLGYGSSRSRSRTLEPSESAVRVSYGPPKEPPPWSALPKADEMRPTVYAAPGGVGVEAEGVCRLDERAIACWDPSGRPAPALQSRIAALLAHPKEAYDGEVRLRFGRKNRIVVLRQTLEPVGKDEVPRYSVRVDRIGEGGSSSRPLPASGEARKEVWEVVHFVQEASDAERLHLRLTVHEALPTVTRIGLEEGASCDYDGTASP